MFDVIEKEREEEREFKDAQAAAFCYICFITIPQTDLKAFLSAAATAA